MGTGDQNAGGGNLAMTSIPSGGGGSNISNRCMLQKPELSAVLMGGSGNSMTLLIPRSEENCTEVRFVLKELPICMQKITQTKGISDVTAHY